jgi:hypothetical protein
MAVGIRRVWNDHADDENWPELLRTGNLHFPLSFDVLHTVVSHLCHLLQPPRVLGPKLTPFVVVRRRDYQPPASPPNHDKNGMGMLRRTQNDILLQVTGAGFGVWTFGGHYGAI